MSRSMAIVGKMTVVKPLSSVLMPVMRVTDAMTIAVVAFEVFASSLSSTCEVDWSLRASLATVEGRPEVSSLAKTGWGACGNAMCVNSIDVRDMLVICPQHTRRFFRTF